MLFSLVLLQFIDFVKLHGIVNLHLWYLDGGMFIGPKSCLLQLLESFLCHGPQFGLHLNLSKCESVWPPGDSFPLALVRAWSSWVPLYGEQPLFFNQNLSARLTKVAATQDNIAILEDPQIELHLLHSCLGSCNLLCTVPFNMLQSFLN